MRNVQEAQLREVNLSALPVILIHLPIPLAVARRYIFLFWVDRQSLRGDWAELLRRNHSAIRNLGVVKVCACEIHPKEYIVHCGGEPHLEGTLRQFPKLLLMLDVIARRGVRVDASTSLYLRWETLGECSSNCILCQSHHRSLVSDGPQLP